MTLTVESNMTMKMPIILPTRSRSGAALALQSPGALRSWGLTVPGMMGPVGAHGACTCLSRGAVGCRLNV
jgi:hypothetical protein